jgi:hypothetical protein
LLLIAGLIHLLLTPQHFAETAYLGTLFLANFVGSILAAFGIYRGLRWGWALGALFAGGAFFGSVRLSQAQKSTRSSQPSPLQNAL